LHKEARTVRILNETKEFRSVTPADVKALVWQPGFELKRLVTRGRVGSDRLLLGTGRVATGFAQQTGSVLDRDEAIYVVRGKIKVYWNDREITVGEGEAVFVPQGGKLRTVNAGDGEAFFVYAQAPPVE
jgi:mannose-6-phosphate isomerase-like protein (cupin superfamily)